MADFLIECGYRSLFSRRLTDWMDSPFDEPITRLRERFRLGCNADLDVMIYSGTSSRFGGGRVKDQIADFEELRLTVDKFNDLGISYMLALNGGLQLPPDAEPEKDELAMIGHLAANNNNYSVENKVTITHPNLYNIIKQEFPQLDIIASCIQGVNPHDKESYHDKFVKYDFVVLPNQATYSYYNDLKKYAEFAHKIIVFLTLTCGNPNRERCYRHYIKMENGDEYHKDIECSGKALWRRPKDLKSFLSMGVNKFKVPRDDLVPPKAVDILISLINSSRQLQVQESIT